MSDACSDQVPDAGAEAAARYAREFPFRLARATHACLGFEGCATCRDIAGQYGVPLAEMRRFMSGVRLEDRFSELDPDDRRQCADRLSGYYQQRLFEYCLALLRQQQARNLDALGKAVWILAALLRARTPDHAFPEPGRDGDRRLADMLPPPFPVLLALTVLTCAPPARVPIQAGTAG